MSQNTGPIGPSRPTQPTVTVGPTGPIKPISPAGTNGSVFIPINNIVAAPVLSNGIYISAAHVQQWINGMWGYIEATSVEPIKVKKDDRDGCDCSKCGDFYPMAEPNRDDGTLICYKCRHGW